MSNEISLEPGDTAITREVSEFFQAPFKTAGLPYASETLDKIASIADSPHLPVVKFQVLLAIANAATSAAEALLERVGKPATEPDEQVPADFVPEEELVGKAETYADAVTRLFAQEALCAPLFLRTLAQTYLLDVSLGPTGKRLCEIADALDKGETPR